MKAITSVLCATAALACVGFASAESLAKGSVYLYVHNCTNVVGGSDVYFYTEIDESATKSAQARKTKYGKVVEGSAKNAPNVMKFESPLLTWETVCLVFVYLLFFFRQSKCVAVLKITVHLE